MKKLAEGRTKGPLFLLVNTFDVNIERWYQSEHLEPLEEMMVDDQENPECIATKHLELLMGRLVDPAKLLGTPIFVKEEGIPHLTIGTVTFIRTEIMADASGGFIIVYTSINEFMDHPLKYLMLSVSFGGTKRRSWSATWLQGERMDSVCVQVCSVFD